MINEQTIISSFDDKGTLLKWLKAVENALEKASATEFLISKKGNSTISFILKFADDTQLESGDITLEQGESVESASIVNGHLLLTLTNGKVLDAGNLFNGNVNIDGNFTANSIIENMSGYSISNKNAKATFNYAGVVKNGNKLTIALFLSIQLEEDLGVNLPFTICHINLPLSVANKLTTTTIEGVQNIVNNQKQVVNYALNGMQEANLITYRYGQTLILNLSPLSTPMLASRSYLTRIEMTFLLSDNLAGE